MKDCNSNYSSIDDIGECSISNSQIKGDYFVKKIGIDEIGIDELVTRDGRGTSDHEENVEEEEDKSDDENPAGASDYVENEDEEELDDENITIESIPFIKITWTKIVIVLKAFFLFPFVFAITIAILYKSNGLADVISHRVGLHRFFVILAVGGYCNF